MYVALITRGPLVREQVGKERSIDGNGNRNRGDEMDGRQRQGEDRDEDGEKLTAWDSS